MIIAEELFDRIVALIQLEEHRAPEITGMLYDTLKLACREALSNNRELFGNLFSQVDYLSRKYSMHLRDVVAIQKMRSETRTGMQFSSKELLSHARALSIFISTIFQTAIPTRLNHLLPRVYYISKAKREINYRRIRALVLSVQSDAFKVRCEQFEDIKEMTVPLKRATSSISFYLITRGNAGEFARLQRRKRCDRNRSCGSKPRLFCSILAPLLVALPIGDITL